MMIAQIEAAGEFKGAVISTHQQNELCQKTMEIFIRVGSLHVSCLTMVDVWRRSWSCGFEVAAVRRYLRLCANELTRQDYT